MTNNQYNISYLDKVKILWYNSIVNRYRAKNKYK